jgi:hypothetical protein
MSRYLGLNKQPADNNPIPKGDIKMQGTREDKGSFQVERPAVNNQFSSGFHSKSGFNYGGGPKFNLPKTELKKFDGTKVFT